MTDESEPEIDDEADPSLADAVAIREQLWAAHNVWSVAEYCLAALEEVADTEGDEELSDWAHLHGIVSDIITRRSTPDLRVGLTGLGTLSDALQATIDALPDLSALGQQQGQQANRSVRQRLLNAYRAFGPASAAHVDGAVSAITRRQAAADEHIRTWEEEVQNQVQEIERLSHGFTNQFA